MTNRVIVTIELEDDVEIQLPEGARVVSIYSPDDTKVHIPWVDDQHDTGTPCPTYRDWIWS